MFYHVITITTILGTWAAVPMANLDGGDFIMGIDDYEGLNGEAPSFKSAVKPFQIDKFPVTNEEFSQFAKAKPNFTTDAETRGWSFVFEGYLNRSQVAANQHHPPDEREPWMLPLRGANWRQPLGDGSSIDEKMSHPVVHVSKRDAVAFCFWSAHKRLPTEHEWEFAARGGLHKAQYPWGDQYEKGRVNIWQGKFPANDSGRDGFVGTSPVTAFQPQNKYGMRDMVGNVWEWTSTEWHLRFHSLAGKEHHYTLKGGSHLDSRRGHVGHRARISTRIAKMLHYSSGNVGFRCAKTIAGYETPAMKYRKSLPLWYHSEL